MTNHRAWGQTERSPVSELRDRRNKGAHQEAFSSDDACRVLDSAARLLSVISASQVEKAAATSRQSSPQICDLEEASSILGAPGRIRPAGFLFDLSLHPAAQDGRPAGARGIHRRKPQG
jgi:hypothetical protein